MAVLATYNFRKGWFSCMWVCRLAKAVVLRHQCTHDHCQAFLNFVIIFSTFLLKNSFSVNRVHLFLDKSLQSTRHANITHKCKPVSTGVELSQAHPKYLCNRRCSHFLERQGAADIHDTICILTCSKKACYTCRQ